MRKALTLSAFVVFFTAALAAAVSATIVQSRTARPIEATAQPQANLDPA